MLAQNVTVKTKRGANKRINAILNQCYKDCKGGLQYGLDLSTMAINWPDRYREYIALKRKYNTLPAYPP